MLQREELELQGVSNRPARTNQLVKKGVMISLLCSQNPPCNTTFPMTWILWSFHFHKIPPISQGTLFYSGSQGKVGVILLHRGTAGSVFKVVAKWKRRQRQSKVAYHIWGLVMGIFIKSWSSKATLEDFDEVQDKTRPNFYQRCIFFYYLQWKEYFLHFSRTESKQMTV